MNLARLLGWGLIAAIASVMAAMATAAAPHATSSDTACNTSPGPTTATTFQCEWWLTSVGWSPELVTANLAFPSVAVVDSGMSDTLPQFAGLIGPDSASCMRDRPRSATSPSIVNDQLGHGTQVASLAAGPENGLGIVGVSPQAPLVVVKITDNPNDLSRLFCGLNYLSRVAEAGPLVVNLSLAAPAGAIAQGALSAAINRLVARGALVVAATGNQAGASGPIQLPAALPHVVAVGDSGLEHLLRGPQLALLAPGNDLLLPQPDNSYQWVSGPGAGGTSYSAALVSGAASVVWAHQPQVTNPEVITYLLERGTGRSWHAATGFGLINIGRSLRLHPPRDDETEPNDTPRSATFSSCRSSCVLYGIASRVNDPVDYWRLSMPRCRHVRSTGGVRVSCRRGQGGIILRVVASSPLVAYRVMVG